MKAIFRPGFRFFELLRVSGIGILLAGTLLTGRAWASPSYSPCSGTYNLGTGTNGLVSPGTASAGCEQLDKEFAGFTYTTNGEQAGDAATPGDVDVSFSGSSETGGITDTFGTAGTSVWEGPGGHEYTSTQTNSVQVDSTYSYAISELELSESGAYNIGSSSDYVEIVMSFCTGTTTYGCSSTSTNYGEIVYLLDGNGSTGVVWSGSCYNNGGTTACSTLAGDAAGATNGLSMGTAGLALTLPSLITSIAVQNLVEGNSGNESYTHLDTYDNEFIEASTAPEPASVVLLGSALLGLGLLRFRKARC